MLKVVGSFLTNRTMVVKAGQEMSDPREVWGGCPQGSILGVFLFNATIDGLEEDCIDITNSVTGVQEPDTGAEESSEEEEEPGTTEFRPTSSTPKRQRNPLRLTESPVCGPNGPKIKKRKRRPRRLNISGEVRQEVPLEKNAKTEAKWRAKLGALLRFIDDGFSLTKVNFENSYGFEVSGTKFRIKHAVQSQNIFRHLVRKAEEIGMVVNTKKTAMMCVSDSLAFEADAFILDADGNRIGCQKVMKVLGMNFSNRPNMWAHVEAICRGIRRRYWTLRNLKNSGFTEKELVTVYKTIIRPVAEYGAVVFHSSLTEEQTNLIERCQNNALKCIYGAGLSAREMREKAEITTLHDRRNTLVNKFASKCASNPHFARWFPLKQSRRSERKGVRKEHYIEMKARCDRLKNSPFYDFRRRLNGQY